MDFIKEPIDEFVTVMMLIIVKQCIGSFKGQDKSSMVVCSSWLFITREIFEQKMQLV